MLIGQDAGNAAFLLGLLRERVEKGDTVVMVNHARDHSGLRQSSALFRRPQDRYRCTENEGETKTYTGVAINDLLGKAGPKAEATTLVFVADDGYTAEVPLADVQACGDCIISFRDQGGFSVVLPGFVSSAQVKGVTEIQIN